MYINNIESIIPTVQTIHTGDSIQSRDRMGLYNPTDIFIIFCEHHYPTQSHHIVCMYVCMYNTLYVSTYIIIIKIIKKLTQI